MRWVRSSRWGGSVWDIPAVGGTIVVRIVSWAVRDERVGRMGWARGVGSEDVGEGVGAPRSVSRNVRRWSKDAAWARRVVDVGIARGAVVLGSTAGEDLITLVSC